MMERTNKHRGDVDWLTLVTTSESNLLKSKRHKRKQRQVVSGVIISSTTHWIFYVLCDHCIIFQSGFPLLLSVKAALKNVKMHYCIFSLFHFTEANCFILFHLHSRCLAYQPDSDQIWLVQTFLCLNFSAQHDLGLNGFCIVSHCPVINAPFTDLLDSSQERDRKNNSFLYTVLHM